MRRLAILSSIAALALCGANCGNTTSLANAGNGISPSNVAAGIDASSDAVLSAQGKSGGGGGKTKPGSSSGSSSMTLVMVTDNNANGLPNWGDTITWQISTTATTEPNVSVTCSQNGVVVYGAVSGYYSSYPAPWTQNMTLTSNSWTGGAASCVAQLYYFSGTSTINLASTTFTAGA